MISLSISKSKFWICTIFFIFIRFLVVCKVVTNQFISLVVICCYMYVTKCNISNPCRFCVVVPKTVVTFAPLSFLKIMLTHKILLLPSYIYRVSKECCCTLQMHSCFHIAHIHTYTIVCLLCGCVRNLANIKVKLMVCSVILRLLISKLFVLHVNLFIFIYLLLWAWQCACAQPTNAYDW